MNRHAVAVSLDEARCSDGQRVVHAERAGSDGRKAASVPDETKHHAIRPRTPYYTPARSADRTVAIVARVPRDKQGTLFDGSTRVGSLPVKRGEGNGLICDVADVLIYPRALHEMEFKDVAT